MTTGKMYYHDKPDVFQCAGGHFQSWLGYRTRHDGAGLQDVGQYDQPRRVTNTPTCCLLMRRSVFDRVGLMDSRYFVYSDDADFLYRALKQGLSLWYVPEAKLWHKVSSLTGVGSAFSLHYSSRNRAYFITKHLTRIYAAPFNLLYPAYYLLRFALGKDTRDTTRIKQAAWTEGKKM
jgi:GT2 family glycosyltransferase